MRKKIKLDLQKEQHKVLPGCHTEHCKKQCFEKITEDRRSDVNFQYWNMTWKERRVFILSTCQCVDVKTRKNKELTNRKNTLKFYITDDRGNKIQVCKPFFLTTLGFKKTNDRVLDVLRHYPNGQVEAHDDLRGNKPPKKYLYQHLIEDHIESFNPTISHYRREHAPNVRYLPSDITVTLMHQLFLEKYPEPQYTISYDYYRNQVSKKNISFTVLGHEECEVCESLKIHEHSKDNLVNDCEICQTYFVHKEKADVARALYQEHAKKEFDEKSIYVTVDLQKVIMLPRVDTFKKVLFTKRIVA